MQLPKEDSMVEVMDDRRDRTSETEARKSREIREMKVSVIKDDDKKKWVGDALQPPTERMLEHEKWKRRRDSKI